MNNLRIHLLIRMYDKSFESLFDKEPRHVVIQLIIWGQKF